MEPKPSRTPVRTESGEGEPFDWFLRIPNRLELMKPIRGLVSATCENHGADEEAMQELLLAISEIINNSIEHVKGRGDGGYHEVDFRFGVRDGLASGCVVDEGEGGVAQADFDGASQPSMDSDRGRGLLLIKVYLDSISVRAVPGVGTEIRFTKRIVGGGGDA